MTFHKSEWRTAIKFSMTGCILMTVSHFESVMDHWINATAFLNDLNILSNYDFTILLYKLKVQCNRNHAKTRGSTKFSPQQGWCVSCCAGSPFPLQVQCQDHRLGEDKDPASSGSARYWVLLSITIPQSLRAMIKLKILHVSGWFQSPKINYFW